MLKAIQHTDASASRPDSASRRRDHSTPKINAIIASDGAADPDDGSIQEKLPVEMRGNPGQGADFHAGHHMQAGAKRRLHQQHIVAGEQVGRIDHRHVRTPPAHEVVASGERN